MVKSAKPSKKSKKRVSSDKLNAKKTIPKAKKINPFDVHVNKEKFSILGRESLTSRGLPAVSRGKAIKKRKMTLGVEIGNIHKANTFKDRRIGVGVGRHTLEDVATARFTAERLSQIKKSDNLYNLEDDNDVDDRDSGIFHLTHKGQTIEKIEQYQDALVDANGSDSDDDEGRLNAEYTSAAHFGGGPARDLYERQSAIDDLIAASKLRKEATAHDREQVAELTEKLDENWRSLMPAVRGMLRRDEDRPKPDEFDRALREMVFERRGEPTDKLRSDADLMKQEKERLEQLENDRLRRMRGIASNTSSVPNHRSADALDDDPYELVNNVEAEYQEPDDNCLSEPENEDADNGSESEEENDEEDNMSDLKEDSASSEDEIETDQREIVCKEIIEKATAELPFIFDMPNSYDELQELLQGYQSSDQAIIVERMLKYNNSCSREQITQLFAFLLQYINDMFIEANENSVGTAFTTLDSLTPTLFDLVKLSPATTSQCYRDIIREKQKEYRVRLKSYPTLETLVFLKLIPVFFPVSDFRHHVVTPALIFIGQILARARVVTRADIARGLWLVTICLEWTLETRRFVPAAFNFLYGVLLLGTPRHSVEVLKVPPPFHAEQLLVCNSRTIKPVDNSDEWRFLLSVDLIATTFNDSFRHRALHSALGLTHNAFSSLELSTAKLYADRFIRILDRIEPTLVTASIHAELSELMSNISSSTLHALVSAEKRPKALRLMEPKIELVFDDKRRDRSQSNARSMSANNEMIAKIKRVTKGAVRELRRDTAFIAKKQLKLQLQSDAERKAKVKRIMSEASVQQGELNALDRQNKRKR